MDVSNDDMPLEGGEVMRGDQSDNKPPSTNNDCLVGFRVFDLLNFFLVLPPAIVNRSKDARIQWIIRSPLFFVGPK